MLKETMLTYKVRSAQPFSNFLLFGKQILLNSVQFYTNLCCLHGARQFVINEN